MDYKEAQEYFAAEYKWHIHEETFQSLDKENWIAKITTMFHTERGEPEASFYLLYSVATHQQYRLHDPSLLSLRNWCTKIIEGDIN